MSEMLTQEFEKCRPQLRSYILRMTASVDDAEDIVQDTYIKAFSNIQSFKGESSLKTWIFAIASNLAKDLLKTKKRWVPNVTDICKEAAMSIQQFFEEAMAKYYLHVARTKMIEIFDGRCALINKQGTCHQCTELNGIFNPKQNVQVELMKIDMVQEANSPDKAHLLDLRLKIIRNIDPFESDAAELQLHHLKHNKGVMDKYLQEV